MQYENVEATREFVARLEHGRDWREQIEAFAAEEGVTAGFFYGLGAVQDAVVWFYNQDTKE